MGNRYRSSIVLGAAVAVVFTTGFGFGKKAPPPKVFDPERAAAEQAQDFIGLNKAVAKHMGGVGRIAITSCNVMFAFKSNATAATAGGLFAEAGNTSRMDANVSVEYTLQGADDALMQALTDQICVDAERQVRDAGYDVIAADELRADPNFQGIHANGRPAPYVYKAPGKDSKTRYQVYAPSGQSIYDMRFIGFGAGFGAAMKQAKGESPELYEGRVVDAHQATAMRISLLVDFAQLQSDGRKGALGGLASKDKAKVGGEVRLAVSGDITLRPPSAFDCWERFGKRECMGKPNKFPSFTTTTPVVSQDVFYRDVVNSTTKGDKIGSAVSKGLAVVSALGGVSSRSYKITRYTVDVDPAVYGEEVKKYAAGMIEMALARSVATR